VKHQQVNCPTAAAAADLGFMPADTTSALVLQLQWTWLCRFIAIATPIDQIQVAAYAAAPGVLIKLVVIKSIHFPVSKSFSAD
jgi:hypothetical protein